MIYFKKDSLLRFEAFRDIPAAAWRFDNASVMTPQLVKAWEYAENWDSFSREGIGLLLFGNVGTGKTYAAGCIANALIDRMISVLYVGMSNVVNRMQGNFGADRDSYIKQLMRPDLLILDDLGAERNTSYGKECVFDVVNRRLLSGKPMIITTNITLSAMQKATISMIAVFMTAYWKCVSRSCSTEKTSAKATPLKTSKKRLNC